MHLCIVIPCYNEEKGLAIQEYVHFVENNPTVLICFVNDSSTDATLEILEGLKNKYPEHVKVLSYKNNRGKAEAIRSGVHFCNENYTFDYLAYLDADLATSLEECAAMTSNFNNKITFVFGSRIRRIGAVIERSPFRFFAGRIIATIISHILKLNVYDTQCGCKVFTKTLAEEVFKKPFVSKWLFDVELFDRIIKFYGREVVLEKMLEVPLLRWVDRGDSKVKATYFLKLWVDLYLINKICNSNN
ncbi:MAG: glycosyl transferase family 2 [Flavobacteriaceae bacterium CG_4_8_14_3_um_filter_34_10]|nr:glycosyltransferase [Flavobacteriia bacterium]PIX08163.1 MAG: glycosyl transferase family 2 [Flavobacteriaceae bacterium CG_4_8_14_3_um_filter_34_10]